MAPVLVPLRPSSEHILIVRAPEARDQHGCHSAPFIVGALRARRAPGRSYPILDLPLSNSASHCGSFVACWITSNKGMSVKQGYRLIIVDKAGVLVSEFQLTENALAQPEAFVAALKQSIDDIEEEEP